MFWVACDVFTKLNLNSSQQTKLTLHWDRHCSCGKHPLNVIMNPYNTSVETLQLLLPTIPKNIQQHTHIYFQLLLNYNWVINDSQLHYHYDINEGYISGFECTNTQHPIPPRLTLGDSIMSLAVGEGGKSHVTCASAALSSSVGAAPAHKTGVCFHFHWGHVLHNQTPRLWLAHCQGTPGTVEDIPHPGCGILYRQSLYAHACAPTPTAHVIHGVIGSTHMGQWWSGPPPLTARVLAWCGRGSCCGSECKRTIGEQSHSLCWNHLISVESRFQFQFQLY